MPPVAVRILHPEPGAAAGPLERWVASERADMARRHAASFTAAGSDDVRIVAGPPDDTPFGARLRSLAAGVGGGLVVLGSGAIPLASARDRRAFVAVAGGRDRVALANDRYSADVIAVARADVLRDVPDLPADNALPRWLEEVAGYEVRDMRRRWRLGVDVDGPLDILLMRPRSRPPAGVDLGTVRDRWSAVRSIAGDRRAELLVAGRTSATALAWLERMTASRTRALVEERGLRTRPDDQRPAASVLGMLIDRDGPGALGPILAGLGDAAIVDTRVLLAHRYGSDERGWPRPEDRFASDLLLPERIDDPWLRALTGSARDAPIPVVLGGHTLVGPGLRLVVGTRRR